MEAGAMTETFTVDWPPGANQIWRAYKGRNILAARYRAWRDLAGKQLLVQRARPIPGPVAIRIELVCPQKISFDLDNRIKPLLDLLVDHGVIEADGVGIVKSIHVSEGEGFTGARLSVAAWEAAP
jgi:Holliday junction resolvase RusA-like endonuclease